MTARLVLYIGAVMLGIMLLIDRPVPIAIAPAQFDPPADTRAG